MLDNKNLESEIRDQFEMGIKKAKKQEKRSMMKYVKTAAASLAITVGVTTAGCYLSPTFAETVKELPIIKQFYQLLEGEKNLKTAVDNFYGEELNLSYKKDGYEFKILHAIRDNKKLVFSYELAKDGKKIDQTSHFNNIVFSDDDGYEFKYDGYPGLKSFFGEGLLEFQARDFDRFWHGDYELKKELNFNDVEENIYMSCDVKVWNSDKFEHDYVFAIDKMKLPLGMLEKSRGYEVNIDEIIEIGDKELTIEKISVEPTEMELNLKWKGSKSDKKMDKFKDISFHIEDDNGDKYVTFEGHGTKLGLARSWDLEKYDENGNNIADTDTINYEYAKKFNSPYFSDVDYLIIKEIRMNFYEEYEMCVNIKDKEIISSNYEGLKIDDIVISDESINIYYSNFNIYHMWDKLKINGEIKDIIPSNFIDIDKRKSITISKYKLDEIGVKVEDIDTLRFNFKVEDDSKAEVFKGEIKIDLKN